jgi:hypothetical protein
MCHSVLHLPAQTREKLFDESAGFKFCKFEPGRFRGFDDGAPRLLCDFFYGSVYLIFGWANLFRGSSGVALVL